MKIKLPCPTCGNQTVILHTLDTFLTAEYVDIPAHCETCKEELLVLYDFRELTLD